jgi:protein JSN1
MERVASGRASTAPARVPASGSDPLRPFVSCHLLLLIKPLSDPQRKVAVNIILNSIPLATSPNGALLVTWLLVSTSRGSVNSADRGADQSVAVALQESSQLPGRYSLLASRFEPHLAHLCSHKLASASVLRIINQHESPEGASSPRRLTRDSSLTSDDAQPLSPATTRILRGLFLSPNDETLTEVLRDREW